MKITRGGVGAAMVVALAALGWWAVAAVSPPAPVSADAPAEQFSAERAFEHVQAIAAEPHPAGSPAAARARDYIVDTLTGFGLDPQVQQSVGVHAEPGIDGGFGATGTVDGTAMAQVQNVVATIPGTNPSGTVYLMTHYDSVQVSPGANDDGTGVATLLESARALLAGPRPQNDIVLLFTDAEESCRCGAEAYLHDNPDVTGVVLNVEARGSNGPAIMFETSAGNAGVVSVYADAAPYPVATSFAVEVYRLLPNDTDFSPFMDSGRFTGLNTAHIDGSVVYHTAQDSTATFSTSTLQHHGTNSLALAAAFGEADLSALTAASGGDASYFPVLGMLVTYPLWVVWMLALGALASAVTATWLLLRRGRASGRRLVSAGLLTLIPLLLPAVTALGLWQLLVLIRPDYGSLADPWHPGWYRIAVVALVFAIVAGWFAALRRRFGSETLLVAAVLWVALLGLALAVVTPGGSYLAALPALALGLAAIVRLTIGDDRVRALAGLAAGAVAIILLAPTAALFFPAVGMRIAAAPALLTTLAALTLLPVLDLLLPASDFPVRRPRVRAALPVLAAATIAVLATGAGLVVDRVDASRPVPVEMMYAMDASTGEAFWVRCSDDPTGWSDALVTTERDLSAPFPLLPAATTVGSAPAASLSPATVEVLADERSAAGRTVTLRIVPRADARVLFVETPDGVVASATAQGRAVPVAEDGHLSLVFHAPPGDGLLLTLELTSTDPTALRVMDGTDDLASIPGFVARPDGVGTGRSQLAEMVLVATDVTI